MSFGTSSLGELVVTVGTDLKKLNSGLSNAQALVQKVGAKMAGDMESAGRRMAIAGAAITGVVSVMASSAITFESAFAGVRKTVDASEEEFQKLITNFRGISKEIPITAAELSEIGEVAGQLGVRGVENITKFTKTIGLIEVTTNLAREEAATNMARIANVMKEPIANIDRMGAAVVALGNNFAANEREIVNFSTRISAAGRIIGMSTADVFAIGAAFTSVGIEAEAGGTAVQKIINDITEAVATGNDKLAIFANVAGMTVEEFKRLKKENPAEVFYKFVEGLGAVGDDAFLILERLGLSNERVIRSMLSMAKSSDILKDALRTSGVAWKENTALQIEANKRFLTTASQLKIFKNNITDVGITLGETLLPIINNLLEKLKPIITNIADWIKNNKELTARIILGTAAFGAMLLVFGTSSIIFANVIRGLLLVISPMGILITVSALLITAWLKNWGNIREITWAVASAVGKFIDSIVEKTTKMILTFRALSKISLKERLLHPILSLKKAMDEANKGYESLTKEGGLTNFGEDFAAGIDKAIDKTEEFNAAMARLGKVPDSPKLENVIPVEIIPAESSAAVAERLDEEQRLKDEAEAADEARRRKQIANSYAQETSIFNFWKRLQQVRTDAENNHEKTRQLLRQQSYDQFVSLLEQASAQSKTAAALLKAVRIGEAIANTATGVTQALAAYPPPMSFVMASLVSALGAAQIALISGVKFATGTDTVPAMLTPGEGVIPRTFMDAIREGRLSLSGPENQAQMGRDMPPVNVYMSDVKINSTLDIDEVAEQLGTNIQKKMRSK